MAHSEKCRVVPQFYIFSSAILLAIVKHFFFLDIFNHWTVASDWGPLALLFAAHQFFQNQCKCCLTSCHNLNVQWLHQQNNSAILFSTGHGNVLIRLWWTVAYLQRHRLMCACICTDCLPNSQFGESIHVCLSLEAEPRKWLSNPLSRQHLTTAVAFHYLTNTHFWSRGSVFVQWHLGWRASLNPAI